MFQKTLMVAAVTAAVASFAVSAQAADKTAGKEKCYGVAKAGKNDCAAGQVSCAASTKKDGEGFIAVPKGLCDKLVGGSLTAK